MDIIAKAKARLTELETERGKLVQFLELAEELGADVGIVSAAPAHEANTGSASAQRKRDRANRPPPKSGVVYDTMMAVRAYMLSNDVEAMRTRDMVPVVEQAGIEIGGQNPVATMSARVHSSQMFELRDDKWALKDAFKEETADNPAKATSAASTNNEGGRYGTALV